MITTAHYFWQWLNWTHKSDSFVLFSKRPQWWLPKNTVLTKSNQDQAVDSEDWVLPVLEHVIINPQASDKPMELRIAWTINEAAPQLPESPVTPEAFCGLYLYTEFWFLRKGNTCAYGCLSGYLAIYNSTDFCRIRMNMVHAVVMVINACDILLPYPERSSDGSVLFHVARDWNDINVLKLRMRLWTPTLETSSPTLSGWEAIGRGRYGGRQGRTSEIPIVFAHIDLQIWFCTPVHLHLVHTLVI